MTPQSATSFSEAVGDHAGLVTPTQPPGSDELLPSHPHYLGQDDDEEEVFQDAGAPNKKRKRAKKSTASRGPTALPKSCGTGFEEYYADPPMTPQEAAEETMEIYAGDVPFEDRIQACIQRFRSRRRLQQKTTFYFNEYLFLGGVDTSPGAFTGQDPRALKNLTPAERRDATATDIVYGGSAGGDRFYNGDNEHWSVDFAGVAAGFCSRRLAGLEKAEVNIGVGVVENFLRYILQHDVCPEHADNIKKALKICDVAREEWAMLGDLTAALPGQFNLAAAELVGRSDERDWALHAFTPAGSFTRPENFDPKTVFYSAVALMDEPDLFARLQANKTPQVTGEFACTLQFISVMRPTDDIVKRFESLALDSEHVAIPAVGKATAKLATIEDEWDHPPQPLSFAKDEEVTLYFDDAVLANIKPGMKANLTLCELDVGIIFVKTMAGVVPSFYTFLPQEMMRHYKAPRESTRPAPSVHDPDADEKQMDKEAKNG